MPRSRNFYDKQPHFLEHTIVEISVPSGKLIASDNLQGPAHFDIDPPMSINYGYGTDLYSKEFAEKANTAYASVGNTCPSIVRLDSDQFKVARARGNENCVAKIVTDLWAVMLTDYQNWLDNGGPSIETANDGYSLQKFTVFDVTPGKYRWTVLSHSDNFDTDSARTFAHLDLIEAY